jgi:protein-S-isoprenylcysteine O-methyltransferase Ste14
MIERVFVWAGGVIFVVSLATCALWYTFILSDPHRAGQSDPAAALVFDAVLFVVFAAHHSLLARRSFKTWLARFVPERMLRTVYVVVASLLLLMVCAWWRPVGGELYDVRGWRALVHVLIQLIGLAIVAAAVRRIDALELAGIHEPPARSSDLQIAGPYRWVRHPIYLGWVLMVFGAGHMTFDRLAFAAITTAYLFAAIPWEERSLAESAGRAYESYKEKVRWRVLPYVF